MPKPVGSHTVVAVIMGGPHDGAEHTLEYRHTELYLAIEPSDLAAWQRGDVDIAQAAYRPVEPANGTEGQRIRYQYAGPIKAQFHTRGADQETTT